MVENNIAQTFENVKQEILTTSGVLFCHGTDYLIGMSGVDCNMNDHRVSGFLRGELVRQIMAGSNEQALAVLSAVGNIGFVPGIGENSIPLNEFADFYGVSEKYLSDLLTRRRFHVLYPKDVSRMYLSDILKADAPIVPCCGNQKKSDDLKTFHIIGSHGKLNVSLPQKRMFNLYSPRLVLTTALMMVYTDKSEVEGNIKRTLLALKRSPYRFIKKEDGKKEMDDGVHITTTGDIVLSPEVLTHSLKTAVKDGLSEVVAMSVKLAVKEAVSEVMAEFCIPTAKKKEQVTGHTSAKKHGKFPSKLKKPNNWDNVINAWNSGKLTVKQAAGLAGMSVSSFRSYAGGHKTFD